MRTFTLHVCIYFDVSFSHFFLFLLERPIHPVEDHEIVLIFALKHVDPSFSNMESVFRLLLLNSSSYRSSSRVELNSFVSASKSIRCQKGRSDIKLREKGYTQSLLRYLIPARSGTYFLVILCVCLTVYI